MPVSKHKEAAVLTEEMVTEALDRLASQDPSEHLEALVLLLTSTEASVAVRYAMIEKDVVSAVRNKVGSEDPKVKLAAVRVIARYATYQGKLRKMTCTTDTLQFLWAILEQYQNETLAKAEHIRKREEAALAAEAEAARVGTPSKDKKGGKDKVKEKGKKGKAVEEEQEEGAVFNIPSAALLEAVLRGVCTMVVVDSRATNRLVNCDMTCLMTLMDHPVPLVQERTRSLVSALMRLADLSTALYKAGLQEILVKQLEAPEVPRRLSAMKMLSKLICVPDSRLAHLVQAGVVDVLIRCMAGIPPPQAEVVEAKDTKARGKDRGKEKGGGSDSPEEQDPNVHALQVAAAGLLSQMVELVPDAAEKVTNVNGPDVLRALLPEPVLEQLNKYGIPHPTSRKAAAGAALAEEEEDEDEEEEEEEEEEESPPQLVTQKPGKDAKLLKNMMKSKSQLLAEQVEEEERAQLEREAAEEAKRRKEAGEKAHRAFVEENTKPMPKFKPLAPAVQSCVLGVVRAALRNPELRGRLAEPPWPQILLHLLYEGDPPTPVPLEEPEEKGKKVKDAKGPKGGKVKDAKDSKGKPQKGGKKGGDPPAPQPAEEVEEIKQWVDPPGPMYPPFSESVRVAALECCAELLQDEEAAHNPVGVAHLAAGEEMVWLGRLVKMLNDKHVQADPLNPLDTTLATRIAIALGDIGLGLPEKVLMESRYTQLVKDMAALASNTTCMHLKEAVGRASLVIGSEEHFTAQPEPPEPSPPSTPAPPPLVTSKFVWDALGRPAMVDGFDLQCLPRKPEALAA